MAEITPQHWSYDLLKEIAMREPPAPNFVSELKTMFVNDVGSPRRYECIRTMGDLIDCLERRDVINEQNVEPLRLLGNKELDEAIENYNPPGNTHADVGTNQYHDIRIANEMSSKLSINGHNAPTLNGNTRRSTSVDTTNYSNSTTSLTNANNTYPFALSEQKRTAIYKMLSQHLGTHWRSFGRELGLREGALDEIELQYPRELSTRVYKVMQAFEEDDCHDPKKHLRIIKEALERARRKDLRRKVDDIMSH